MHAALHVGTSDTLTNNYKPIYGTFDDYLDLWNDFATITSSISTVRDCLVTQYTPLNIYYSIPSTPKILKLTYLGPPCGHLVLVVNVIEILDSVLALTWSILGLLEWLAARWKGLCMADTSSFACGYLRHTYKQLQANIWSFWSQFGLVKYFCNHKSINIKS